ncbi:MAG: PAS domain S-box protein, partial [Haliea sp.]
MTSSSTAHVPSWSDSLLHGILNAAMDAIVVIDDNQRVVLFNAAAEAMFGRKRQDTIGSPVTQFMPERFRDGHQALVRGFGEGPALARKMGAGRIVRGLRSNGEEFPVEASISMMVADGRPIYTVIMRDVTERERERAALVRSNADLQQFAFVASHDLRSPLRSIKGYLSLLDSRWGQQLDAPARELIQRASAAVDQLDDLTEDLLSYASLDTEAVRDLQVDCNLALADALRLLEAKLAESGAHVTSDPLPVLRGERPQIVQLFQNLLANAMTYCRDRTPRVPRHARAVCGPCN